MLNNLLLIEGYILCISNYKNQLIGVYVKGTDYRIDDLIEVDDEVINDFKTKREDIVKEIANGRYFIAQYNYQTNTIKTEIREQTYKGPYAEEVIYNTIYKSNDSENLYLSLNSLEKDILINKKDPLVKPKIKVKKQS